MIDEWQEANCLWDATRAEVDSSTDNGLLILTGSSTPKTKGVLHSGSGRIVDLRMNTMSLYESADSTGDVSLKGLCEGSAEQKLTGEVDIRFLANLIVRGGWPRNLETKNPSILPFSYVAKLIDSNLSDEVSDFKYTHHKTELILKSLARNESTTASISSIAKGISEYEDELVSHDTVAKYLEALDRMFLFNNQRPFGPNRRSSLRVKMMEKRHFCDPALA